MDATPPSCPTCSTTLEPREHEGVELDRCPRGCGIWFDRGELPAVVMSEANDRPESEERAALDAAGSDAGHAVVAEVDRPRRPCPRCGEEMRLVEYANSGIAIDECPLHGTWLDDGELQRIEAYAEALRDGTRASEPHAAGTVSGVPVPAELLAALRSTPPSAPPA